MRLQTVALTLTCSMFLSLAGRADSRALIFSSVPPTWQAQTPFRCVSKQKVCWYIDAEGALQGIKGYSPSGTPLIPSDGNLSSFPSVDPSVLPRSRALYAKLREELGQSWTQPAHTLVSAIIDVNLNAVPFSVAQVITEWNAKVNARVADDNSTANGWISGVSTTALGALIIQSLPGGPLVQGMAFQVLMRGAIPRVLESAGYTLDEFPRHFANTVQELAVNSRDADIDKGVSLLLNLTALHYLGLEDSENRLWEDSQDQRTQLEVLRKLVGKPAKMREISRHFMESRDFRLVYASKLVTLLGPKYEEQLNAFIVTGEFAELAWASTGAAARGVVFDLYLPEEGAPSQASAGPRPWTNWNAEAKHRIQKALFRGSVPGKPASVNRSKESIYGIPMDKRHKRFWHVSSRWQLEAKDYGPFTEGRTFSKVKLTLPYWDAPVKPHGQEGPVLRWTPSRQDPAETACLRSGGTFPCEENQGQ